MYFAFNLKTKMKYWFYSILLLLSIIRCFIWSVSQCPYIVVLCTGLWSRKSNISSIHLWFIGKVVLTSVGVPIEYRIDHRQQAAAEDVYSVYLLWQHLKKKLVYTFDHPTFFSSGVFRKTGSTNEDKHFTIFMTSYTERRRS